MAQLVIDLPQDLDQQVKESGLSQQQLGKLVTYLLEIYLKLEQTKEFIKLSVTPEPKKVTRKAGSAKHLGIIIADDFDEPLDDFAEYMQ